VLITPALSLRTAPATTRIHELVATQLGPVEHIRVAADWSGAAQALPGVVAVIDWCSELFRSVPTAVDVQSQSAQGVEILVTFRRTGRDGQPAAATIRLSTAAPSPRLAASIDCRHGDVRLTDAAELDWRSGEHAAHERLDVERSDIEALLDHFARRIVGGLVPVPGLDDVCRILNLLEPHRDAIVGHATRH
jgi:predicted dehydrogenase